MNLYIALGHSISTSQVDLAAKTFGYFCVSLFFQGAVLILARAFFARGDTRRPTLYSLISLSIAWLLAELFSKYTSLGVAGLSLAFSIGSTCNAVLLWKNLGFANKHLDFDSLGNMNLTKIITGSLLSLFVFWASRQFISPLLEKAIAKPSFEGLIIIITSFVLGAATYLIWAKICNLEQWQLIVARNSTRT
jgi:peptidoglycan biosynthesis protein MviN/MurJ (putative lipid II flippase)